MEKDYDMKRLTDSVLQRMDAAVLIADKCSGGFVYISESCREQLGITEEILRSDVEKKKYTGLYDFLNSLLSQSCGEEKRNYYVYNDVLNKEMWIHAASAPIFAEKGRLCIFTLTDMTCELKEMERLRSELEAARSASQEKSRFLSGLSHEIRTPMNVISGMTKLVRVNLEKQEKAARYLDKVEYACLFLQELLSDVLDMSQIESGKVTLIMEEFRLSHLLARLRGLMESQCEGKKQRLEFYREKAEYDCLIGDELGLQRVFLNLLSNASKYTPEGGSILFKVREKKGAERGNVHYIFTVKDTGIGMSPEFMKHLFEPFQRERKNENIEGSGLGLMISKSIVEAMGGQITAESTDGAGSCFTVDVVLKLGMQDGEEEGRTNPVSFLRRNQVLLDKRILLVEDNRLDREMESDLLRLEGVLVEAAENGEEGLNKFLHSEPGYYDAILMDIRMPVMDGYEAARAIRRADRSDAAEIPVIAMTADVFAKDVQAALDAGMNAHLSKPVDMQRLEELLCSLL